MAKKTGKKSGARKIPSNKGRKKAAAIPAAVKETVDASSTRRLKPAKRRFSLSKHPAALPSAWRITRDGAELMWEQRRLFFGIVLVYGLLNLLLVQGLASSTQIGNLKNDLQQTFSGHFGSIGSSLGNFTLLVSSAGNGSSQTAGAYQFFLAIITSLAVIWALRQVYAKVKIKVRDAYYQGAYPLVPFILVLLVVGLELIPFLIGAALYALVMSNGIAVHFAEKLIWALVFVGLALLSLYLMSSSLFALYIVTLPDMTPMKALRSAKGLVRHRRWTVLRKILFLPFILLVAAGVIMVPIIVWITALSQWIFFLLTMVALVAVHTYMYTLYRELLNE